MISVVAHVVESTCAATLLTFSRPPMLSVLVHVVEPFAECACLQYGHPGSKRAGTRVVTAKCAVHSVALLITQSIPGSVQSQFFLEKLFNEFVNFLL